MNLMNIFLEEENIVNILHDKKNGNVSCGYLFYSPDNVTNSYVLKCLARALLCENNGCGVCPNCLKVQEGVHPDVLEFPKDKNLAVNDVKEIIEQANVKPMICDKKIIVINDISFSSEEAQNKLLKTLEEPPKNVYFLISTTNLDKVLPTIKSRLIKQEIKPFAKEQVKEFLKDEQNENFDLALSLGGGFIGKTLDILSNNDFITQYELALNVVCNLQTSGDVIKFVPQKIDKNQFVLLLENLSSMYRDILIIKQKQNNLVKNTQVFSKLNQIENGFSTKALIEIIKCIDNANLKQNSNVSLSLILETLFTKILEVKFLCK